MPTGQLEAVDARRHRLRHIKPWIPNEGTTKSLQILLGKAYAFRELPIAAIPTSRDFSEGSWTSRLNDAGELTITFPNKESSDGQPWRIRFHTEGHLEFIEVYRDDVLEHVDVILKAVPSQQSVILSGQDGWFLLRDAYERDFITIMAPRDIIERYSYVWDLTLGDEFLGNTLNTELWKTTVVQKGTGTASAAMGNGGLTLSATSATGAGNSGEATVENIADTPVIPTNGRWSMVVPFTIRSFSGPPLFKVSLFQGGTQACVLACQFNAESGGTAKAGAAYAYATNREGVQNQVYPNGVNLPQGMSVGHHSFLIECDGRFIRFFVDGYLVNYLPTIIAGATGEVTVKVLIQALETTTASFVCTLNGVIFRQTQPWLMRGEAANEKGDYVLPGGEQTYPYGGLTGRYYNDADLAGYTNYYELCFAPNRTGSGPGGSYKDRTDATLISIEPPFPGAATTYWSVRWFGAIYLKLSQGNYKFKVAIGSSGGCRVWIGKTQFGAQVLDSWVKGGLREIEFTLNAASLGSKDGWYPVVIELFISNTAGTGGINFQFTPPVEYIDPGGTTLKAVNQTVPSTSLSPLGCVDQHYQGQSHFNLTKETAEAYGYQMYCEPRQLESGAFPGQLNPKVRVGRDTDEIVESDSTTSRSPIVNYRNTIDATDQVTSLRGVGSGLPTLTPSGGQIQVEAYNVAAMNGALFDLQGWVDATDINSPALLAVRVASQLGLQLTPWQNIEGEPLGRDRLADSFPLTGILAAMRWRPGDGVRLYLSDVGVRDVTPRQILQITRQFGPIGRHGTAVGFRQRPLDRLSAVNKIFKNIAAGTRKYQRAPITLPTTTISSALAAKTASGAIYVPLQPSDSIISATLTIALNSAAQPIHLLINNVDVTTAYGGPWSTYPANIALSLLVRGAATAEAAKIEVKNEGAAETTVQVSTVVTVLR